MAKKVLSFFLIFYIGLTWVGYLAAQENSEPEIIPKKQTETGPGISPGQLTSPPLTPSPEKPTDSGSSASETRSITDSISMGTIVIGMLVGGFLLLVIEVAVIPGFGIIGIKGIILIFIALVLAYWRLDTQTAIMYTVISVLFAIALTIWLFFVFPHTTLGKKFILNTKISVADGYSTAQDFSRLIGLEGIATSDLRPSGIARLGEERIDVMSEGDFIPRGTKVKAVRIKNGNVVVVPVESPKI